MINDSSERMKGMPNTMKHCMYVGCAADKMPINLQQGTALCFIVRFWQE